jgi:hypothetical protein
MKSLRLAHLRRLYGLSGPVANALARIAYGEGCE